MANSRIKLILSFPRLESHTFILISTNSDATHFQELQYMFQMGVANTVTGWGLNFGLYLFLISVCNHRSLLDNMCLTLDMIEVSYFL